MASSTTPTASFPNAEGTTSSFRQENGLGSHSRQKVGSNTLDPGPNSATAAASGNASNTSTSAADRRAELRNELLLGTIFMVYFGFRSGCLVVIPLCSKNLLSNTEHHADSSPLYNLPLGIWFFMDVILATPNAYLMRAYGRRFGFLLGGFGACVGSWVAFAALHFVKDPITAFVLLNVGVMIMAQVGMAEFVRFAASEACADPARKTMVVSRVIGFGACLSMIGPACASLSQKLADLAGGDELEGFSYFFLCTAALSLVVVAASAALRLPPMTSTDVLPAAPLCTVLKRPPVWSAIVAQVTVQFAMVAPMSGVPLVMTNSIPHLHPADIRVSGCIVLHVLCMFIPGFWTGAFITKLGEVPVMGAGLAIQAASLIVCLTGKNYEQFYTGLGLLGMGWNFAFVAGTLMIVASHTSAERAKVTSANETLRFLANGIGVILASALSWDTLCCVCLAMLLPAAGVLLQRSYRVVNRERALTEGTPLRN
mmetsp:Transcript_52221/g.111178  ORF Transcript_52221/g.111178 Transcript_52221/m.111178 type:complete len:484 (+) Transcript_52221:410-1861(+)